jgi:hypothetical protein
MTAHYSRPFDWPPQAARRARTDTNKPLPAAPVVCLCPFEHGASACYAGRLVELPFVIFVCFVASTANLRTRHRLGPLRG